MNSKYLKRMRSYVRRMFDDLPVRHLDTPTKTVMVPDYTRGLQTNGLPYMVPFETPLPATNWENTQRGIYRRYKKLAAR